MPYRPGIISNTEDYVGELSGLRRRLLKTVRQKIVKHYDSEEELMAESDEIDRTKYNENSLKAQRLAYCLYWAGEKHLEIEACSRGRHFDPCPQCGICRCERGRFRCLCSAGKKMLSPYRIMFINTAIREDWRTKIYSVGEGWVPRKKFQTYSPHWMDVNW